MQSYIPKINPKELCESLSLCSVRTRNNIVMVDIKKLDGEEYEIPLSEIANSDIYMWLPITRVYSSGHVFISEDKRQVFLVTVSKNDRQQIQFTGGSPLEEGLKNVVVHDNWIIKMNIMRIEDNADLRTYNRTGTEVTESYNEIPTVDRVMFEKEDKEWNKFRSLVLLMHFVVKSYKWILSYNLTENITDWQRYDLDKLSENPLIAPNVSIVVNKSLEIINQYQ